MEGNFEKIVNSDNLLYRYIAGSTLYHCNEESSDIDTKGLFICNVEELMGLGFDKSFRDKYSDSMELYATQVNDPRNDNVLYELGKYMSMLLSSNANVLESLYVPEEMMIKRPHECLTGLFANRDRFLTKACFKPFIQYAVEQIKKARGLNKKIVNPITERKGILDFTYTFYRQGSTNIQNWLEYRGLKQEYCGLVNIPNMKDIYGVYYDWGNHMKHSPIDLESLVLSFDYAETTSDVIKKIKETPESDVKRLKDLNRVYELTILKNMANFIISKYDGVKAVDDVVGFLKKPKPIGYSGMIREKSQTLCLSSVSKGELPICYVAYNQDGYVKHCIDYRNYKDWEKFRNPKRYESNLNKNYDSKNMYHSIRLMRMGAEIANGDGLILDRRVAGDRDFLMDIRHHKFEYDELMEIVEKDEKRLNDAINNSKLPDEIDVNLVNDLLIEIRKKFYGML